MSKATPVQQAAHLRGDSFVVAAAFQEGAPQKVKADKQPPRGILEVSCKLNVWLVSGT
jgi:hypothetical protein